MRLQRPPLQRLRQCECRATWVSDPLICPAEELRGFSRTVAEIEWLLVILVMLYQVVQGHADETNAPIYFGLILYSVFVIGFRYFNVYRTESRWKLAIETWVMIVFITWVSTIRGVSKARSSIFIC